jgi:hypothetical protein
MRVIRGQAGSCAGITDRAQGPRRNGIQGQLGFGAVAAKGGQNALVASSRLSHYWKLLLQVGEKKTKLNSMV